MDVELESDGDPSRLSASSGLTLYRIAQEALSNPRVTRPAPQSVFACRSARTRRGCGCEIGARAPFGRLPPSGPVTA